MKINRKAKGGGNSSRESITTKLATETHARIFFSLRVNDRKRQGVTSGIKEEETNAKCLDK